MSEESIFMEALARPSSERADYLAQACGKDLALKAAVEALLLAHERSGNPLDQSRPGPTLPEALHAGVTADYQGAPSAGKILAGRYTLVEPIGEGGMGEVWVAKQSEPVNRKVALKLIKKGMDSKAVLARFEQERQALAVMDHPNIARVLDGGLTESGAPFFVMDLVAGLPLTKYCDAARMPLKERLKLFVDICHAVQHAHQKGIVHRDLKPANILVTQVEGKPVPKIIDFGVAKAISGKLTEETLSTQFGAVIGTMEYMAPEQAGLTAQDIDTRADIYSLGIILYELLTGLRPVDSQRLKKAALDEIIRILREEEAPSLASRLSTDASLASAAATRQLEPRRLLSIVKGELDWIVHRCLEKERNRRYETANGLARDVLRYLADEPIEARPVSVRYRLRKFVKRNKGQVIAASLVLLSLLAGIIGTTWGLLAAQRAQEREAARADGEEKARKQAEEEKRRAIAFRNKALDALRATTGSDVEKLLGAKTSLSETEKAYLMAIAARWQEFAKQEGTDEQTRAVRAEGHHHVAYLWHKLSRREEARLEYERAIVLRKSLADDFPTEPKYRGDLALSHNNLGALLTDLGSRAEALEQYQTAMAIQEKLVANHPNVPGARRTLAMSLSNLGKLLTHMEEWPKAEVHYQKGLTIFAKLAADYPDMADYRHDLANNLNGFGVLLKVQGKMTEAEMQYKKALEVRQKLVDEFKSVPEYRVDLASSHNNLGALLTDIGKLAEATEHHRKALVIREKLVAEFPSMLLFRVEFSESCGNFGNLVRDSGKPADSLPWFRKAIDILQPIYEREPRDVTVKELLKQSYWGRGFAHFELRQFTDAVKDWDQAVLLSEGQDRLKLRENRAVAQVHAGMVAEALAEVAALSTPDANKADRAPLGFDSWHNYACIYAVAATKVPDKKQEYADRAMSYLKNASAAGLRNIELLKNDPDLSVLRDREDFKKLLSELEKRAAEKENQPKPVEKKN